MSVGPNVLTGRSLAGVAFPAPEVEPVQFLTRDEVGPDLPAGAHLGEGRQIPQSARP